MKPKVLVIGLDGGTLSLIEPLAKKGWLPNLAELMKKGCRGPLRSTIPPYTPPAWASIYTGTNPGKHGTFGFFHTDLHTGKRGFSNSTTIGVPKIWEILNKNGIRTGLINLPLTYPPQPLDGYMITGMMTPKNAKNISYPQTLADELTLLQDAYVVDEAVKPRSTLIKRLNHALKGRRAACIHLLKNNSCDFLMTVFVTPDRIQHAYWKYLDKNSNLYDSAEAEQIRPQIEACFRTLDETIGEIISGLADDSLTIIISDHGFQELRGLFLLNKWLAEEGYLSYKTAGKELSQIRDMIRYRIKKSAWMRTMVGPFALVFRNKTKRYGFGTDSISEYAIDWSTTRAYASEQGLFLTGNGGQQQTSGLSPYEYWQLHGEILSKLENFYQGTKVIGHHKDDTYQGPYLAVAPDIILEIDGFAYTIHEGYLDTREMIADFSNDSHGTHDINGLLIAHGKNIFEGQQVSGGSLYDIAPSILSSFGIPIPDYMDGKPLEIFKSGFSLRKSDNATKGKQEEQQDDAVYSQSEAEEMERQLKDMGYI